MPTYLYECVTPSCDAEGKEIELNVPIAERDAQDCAYCGNARKRNIAFTGLTWAPTAGGMR